MAGGWRLHRLKLGGGGEGMLGGIVILGVFRLEVCPENHVRRIRAWYPL